MAKIWAISGFRDAKLSISGTKTYRNNEPTGRADCQAPCRGFTHPSLSHHTHPVGHNPPLSPFSRRRPRPTGLRDSCGPSTPQEKAWEGKAQGPPKKAGAQGRSSGSAAPGQGETQLPNPSLAGLGWKMGALPALLGARVDLVR